MTTATITPGRSRNLQNHVSLSQSIANSFTMAYRGLLKIKRTPEQLIEFLVPRMPRFHIPRYIEFVETLPKTDGTFRVQKFVLRERGVTADTWDREAAGIVLPKD